MGCHYLLCTSPLVLEKPKLSYYTVAPLDAILFVILKILGFPEEAGTLIHFFTDPVSPIPESRFLFLSPLI